MSFQFEKKMSGERDYCSITPEEIVAVSIEYQVNRFNSMVCLWKATKKGRKPEFFEFDLQIVRFYEDRNWKIETSNIWRFDIN